MRHALMSLAVLASLFGAVGQAKANFIGWGSDINCINEQNDGLHIWNSDFGNFSSGWTCPDGGTPHTWTLNDFSSHVDCDWKDLGNLDVNQDDDNCPDHHNHQSGDPSVTPSVDPSVTPAASVPLPAGAWAGLIGVAACGLVTAARRKVAVA